MMNRDQSHIASCPANTADGHDLPHGLAELLFARLVVDDPETRAWRLERMVSRSLIEPQFAVRLARGLNRRANAGPDVSLFEPFREQVRKNLVTSLLEFSHSRTHSIDSLDSDDTPATA